ncbi:tetraacyldisaccharide 4'-kinase [Hydrogenophaga sp.]|uniref:tetraacyldisaccharide 4'-kinase n=1 Tax=Hydrogenophaga sp. TaxID=1904254 RepID=UPI00262982A6|nr:tetraacyldisaccharide 4'-kinase [Hydrogenophaga sp.]MCW5652326.1 tetraacyldisaccharide 4'-kinase [Hydrogenophaga sp.]
MSEGLPPARRQAAWLRMAQHRGPMARLLWPLSWIFGVALAVRRHLYRMGLLRVHHLDVPVIVVGNVVVGGAGKTPCTMALVSHLQARGWQPGVVSRGHGRRGEEVVHVDTQTPASRVGDEPLLIHRRTGVPVCVARRRVDAARALRTRHPEVDILVCDDGMQHLALGRDLTVAVFDERGVGNGWLLPAGLLREPWPGQRTALGMPDLVLRQRREHAAPVELPGCANLPVFDAVRRLANKAFGPDDEHIELASLAGQPLAAVAGIARPEPFFDMLRERGLTLSATLPLPDHAGDEAYEALLQATPPTLVCTEKDAVKLFPLLKSHPAAQAWAVPLTLTPDPSFLSAVDARLAAAGHSPR